MLGLLIDWPFEWLPRWLLVDWLDVSLVVNPTESRILTLNSDALKFRSHEKGSRLSSSVVTGFFLPTGYQRVTCTRRCCINFPSNLTN